MSPSKCSMIRNAAGLVAVLLTLLPCRCWAQRYGPGHNWPIASTQTLNIGGSSIEVDIGEGHLDLPTSAVIAWVSDAARAVSLYYGRFPVDRMRVLVLPVAEEHGVLQGTTWGDIRGFPGFTRMRIGEHTSQDELHTDWTMTHELVHTAFPDLSDDHHWLEEGLATYIEPVARVQDGQLPAAQIWQDMMRGMPKGEPQPGDEGLDHTHTWGRTYWGGALFCLMADVEIRRQTHDKKGLEDALRAVVDAGGTIDKEWPVEQALETGDRATGTTVLMTLYRQWSDAAVPVDLDDLWKKLGVQQDAHVAILNNKAPWAATRIAITTVEHQR